MSRALQIQSLLEATIEPQKLPFFFRNVESIIRRWISDNYRKQVGKAYTADLVKKLNTAGHPYRIHFEIRGGSSSFMYGEEGDEGKELFSQSGSQNNVTGDITVHVNSFVYTKHIMKNLLPEMRTLKSIINHELVHREQFRRSPVDQAKRRSTNFSFSNVDYDWETDSIKRLKKPFMTGRLGNPKTGARTASTKNPELMYRGIPEEIMAHARTLVELVYSRSGQQTRNQASDIILAYLDYGSDHPVYKRFMTLLIWLRN